MAGRRIRRARTGAGLAAATAAALALWVPPAADAGVRLRSQPTSSGTPAQDWVADFNSDGDLDLATVQRNELSVLLGRTRCHVRPADRTIPQAGRADSIATRDFNGDGDPDLVHTDFEADKISVGLGGPGGRRRSQPVRGRRGAGQGLRPRLQRRRRPGPRGRQRHRLREPPSQRLRSPRRGRRRVRRSDDVLLGRDQPADDRDGRLQRRQRSESRQRLGPADGLPGGPGGNSERRRPPGRDRSRDRIARGQRLQRRRRPDLAAGTPEHGDRRRPRRARGRLRPPAYFEATTGLRHTCGDAHRARASTATATPTSRS